MPYGTDITKPFRLCFRQIHLPFRLKWRLGFVQRLKRLHSYTLAYRGDSPIRGNVCDSRQKGSRLPEEKRRRALCATEGYFVFPLNNNKILIFYSFYYYFFIKLSCHINHIFCSSAFSVPKANNII